MQSQRGLRHLCAANRPGMPIQSQFSVAMHATRARISSRPPKKCQRLISRSAAAIISHIFQHIVSIPCMLKITYDSAPVLSVWLSTGIRGASRRRYPTEDSAAEAASPLLPGAGTRARGHFFRRHVISALRYSDMQAGLADAAHAPSALIPLSECPPS